jgi:hypothetical protein
MPASEKTDQQAIDHVLLPNDTPSDLPRHVLHEAGVRRR